MDRYRLTIDNKDNFFQLFADANLNFNNCTLRDVIVTPAENFWEINIVTTKDVDENIFRVAEDFLQRRYHVSVEIKNKSTVGNEIPPAENKSAPKTKRSNVNGKTEKSSGEVVKISSIKENDNVVIIGEVGGGDKNGVSLREFKNGTIGVTFSVTDDTDGIVCKKFFKGDKKSDAQPFADQIKAGTLVKIAAAAKYDDYAKETTLLINKLEVLEKNSARVDNAEVKRVELHVHTQMSAMDAVIPVEKLIQTAADWNWNAVAITDHGVIQAFPNAAQTAAKLAKQGKKIKIIY